MTQNTEQLTQTNRQQQVITLALDHTPPLTHQQIADQLGISRSTVERDITTWLNSPAWQTWLTQYWNRIVKNMEANGDKQDKREVLRSVTALLKRGGVEVNVHQLSMTKVEVEVNTLLKEYQVIIDQAAGKPKTEQATVAGT